MDIYLPTELLVDILLELDIKNLSSTCLTSKGLYSICNDPRFWIAKFKHDNLQLFDEELPQTINQWLESYHISNATKLSDQIKNNIENKIYPDGGSIIFDLKELPDINLLDISPININYITQLYQSDDDVLIYINNDDKEWFIELIISDNTGNVSSSKIYLTDRSLDQLLYNLIDARVPLLDIYLDLIYDLNYF